MLYTLSDIQTILQNGFEYTLPDTIQRTLERIENEINNSAIKKMYATPNTTTYPPKENRHNNNNNNNNNTYVSSSIPNHRLNREKEKEKELSWENIRNFKITKIEKKEGTDKIMNDIRICLNKMSNKNYDTQKTSIFELLSNMNTDSDSEKEELHKVAITVFDIASTNKFYSEMYAKIYKELIDTYPIFQTLLNDFLLQFLNTVSDLKYVDPNVDYDAFCNYNKLNDRKKATAVFIIHMMKQSVIVPRDVIDIIHHLIVKMELCMNTESQLNELEEMTELVNLFVLEGYSFLSSSVFTPFRIEDKDSETCIWQLILGKIREFSQLKVKDKKSLSSRVIFKYMDLCSFIDKNNVK